jgi:transposase
MLRIQFDVEAIEAIKYERLHHPHPRVQQKMWTVWLKVCEVPHHEICRLVGITENTVRAYLNDFAEGGVEALKQLPFHMPHSELDEYRESVEAHFRREPPASVAEAQATIARLTGISRGPTQVRQFLHRMGMKFRKVAAVPAKADPEVQEAFKKKSWSHGWSKPRLAHEGSTS